MRPGSQVPRDELRLGPLRPRPAIIPFASRARSLYRAPLVSHPAILTRPIPSSGEAIPVIGLGTWKSFDVGSSSAQRAPLEEILTEFVSLGGKVVDSSPMYGKAEQVIGDIVARLGLRDRLVIATKVWTRGKRAGVEQMEDSMRKLRVKRVDLMQVHNLVDVADHLDTLRQWKDEGRIRYIGVTHYTASQHDAVARIVASHDLDFIQINYSVSERDAERHLLPLAAERGVAVIANRPFVGGDLVRRLHLRPLPEWASEIECQNWAQVLLKFVVSHPAVTCAIPATSRVEHLRDNMRAGQAPWPDADLRARIVVTAEGAFE